MKLTEAKKMLPQCPYCGEEFKRLRDGKIPTHDFPQPCRSVCRGSGQSPRRRNDTPLYKDDPSQEAKDFFDDARQEFRLYGFAVLKQMALFAGGDTGITQCPLCLGEARCVVAESNGHASAICKTKGCVSATE